MIELPDIGDHNELVARVEQLTATIAGLTELVRTTTNPPLLFKLSEAPAYTGLPRSTISSLLAAGEISYVVIEGSKRLRRSDLDAYVASRQTTAGG